MHFFTKLLKGASFPFLFCVAGGNGVVAAIPPTYWYTVNWITPDPEMHVQFIKFSMNMIAPRLDIAGIYYVWPGLQPNPYDGVYQEVLDARKGTWYIGAGWYGRPSLPWGAGFQVADGGTVRIVKELDETSGNWTSTMRYGDKEVVDSFPIGHKSFQQALLAVEARSGPWNLTIIGPAIWTDIVMVANTSKSAWCTETPATLKSAPRYTIEGLSHTTEGEVTTCRIEKVTMVPADS